MAKSTKVEVEDHVVIQMDEDDARLGQYDGKEADVEGIIGLNPRILKLYVYDTDDIIYLKESAVKLS